MARTARFVATLNASKAGVPVINYDDGLSGMFVPRES